LFGRAPIDRPNRLSLALVDHELRSYAFRSG
jgi:hypothetical protein